MGILLLQWLCSISRTYLLLPASLILIFPLRCRRSSSLASRGCRRCVSAMAAAWAVRLKCSGRKNSRVGYRQRLRLVQWSRHLLAAFRMGRFRSVPVRSVILLLATVPLVILGRYVHRQTVLLRIEWG